MPALGGKTQLATLLMSALVAMSVMGCANKSLDQNQSSLNANNARPAKPGTKRDFSQNVGDIVYFTTGSSNLSPEAQQILVKQARWLKQFARYTITVEGHADERGTREYNIALGARRANAVKRFLAQNGVSARRLRTISFGKERPVAVCNDISCWSQNRRAQTVLNNRASL